MSDYIVRNYFDNLRGLAWIIENPIANIIMCEGMEEHAKRYDEFAKFLNSKGFNVYMIDTYGQGLNVKDDLSNIGVWPENGFVKFIEAVHALRVELGDNTYLFGHSMGSFMVQDYIQRYPGDVKKVVVCGSGSKNPALGIGSFIAKPIATGKDKYEKAVFLNKLMFGSFNNAIENLRTPFDWLSVDNDNVDKYIADPLCGFGPNNDFCYQFILFLKSLYKPESLANIHEDISMLLIAGEFDPVANYGRSVETNYNLYSKLGVMDIQKKIYKGLRHEILNEGESRFAVYSDVAEFFLK